jgi:hypothetical protein
MIVLKIKREGFTIVELLVANIVAIMAFVVLFYVTFKLQGNLNVTSGILGISEKGRFASNRISTDIRLAKSVTSSYGTYSTGDTTIVLQVPSIDANGDIIDPDNYLDIIIYTLDSTNPEQLLRIVDANTASSRSDITETVTEYIDTLSFSSEGTALSSITDKSSIKIITSRIITKTTLPGINRTNEIITSASLRNK